MKLHYEYKKELFCMEVAWSKESSSFTVFQSIVQKLHERHEEMKLLVSGVAMELDRKTDLLMDALYSRYSNYVHNYDPTYPRRVKTPLNEIHFQIEALPNVDATPVSEVILQLYRSVYEQLRDIAEVFLDSNRQDDVRRKQLKHKEDIVPDLDNIESDEPGTEDLLLDMMDISNALDCLTQTQRRRVVQYFFLGFTTQEIADEEKVSQKNAYKSIYDAVKKLNQRNSQC